MPRKKKETGLMSNTTGETLVDSVPQPGAVALMDPSAESLPTAIPIDPACPAETPAPVTATAPATTQAAGGNQRRPAVSWKFPAAAGVTIEVALWPHSITLQSGETIEVYNATVTRSYRDAQGTWQKGGSYRVAELPVLCHAIGVAFAHALNAREMNCPI